jgi:hypothetical protein
MLTKMPAAIILAAAALMLIADAQAGYRRLARLQAPAALPAPAAAPAAADPCCPPAPCCPPVCISYRDRTCGRVCCDPCLPKIQTNIVVCDPCTGCPVTVPVCLPGCCTDCPSISQRCTLFGHGAVTYCWSCGFSATFRFTKHGDVLVTYRS